MSTKVQIRLGPRVGLEVFGIIPSPDNHLPHLKRLASRFPSHAFVAIVVRLWKLFEDLGVEMPSSLRRDASVELVCDEQGQAFLVNPTFHLPSLSDLGILGELTRGPDFPLGSISSIRAGREILRRRLVPIFGAGMECDGPILEALYFAL